MTMGMIPRGSPNVAPVGKDLSTMTLRQANPGDPHRVSGHQSIIRRRRGEELSELTGGGRRWIGHRLLTRAVEPQCGVTPWLRKMVWEVDGSPFCSSDG